MNEFVVTINNKKILVKYIGENRITVDGNEVEYEIENINGNGYLLRLENNIFELHSKKISDDSSIITQGSKTFEVTARTSLQEKALELLSIKNSLNHETEVKAPMPGMILKIKKQVGDTVASGDSIMILEAMKMENELRSVAPGKIKSINVKEGSAVEKGTVLFVIE
ncbi:MAG: acetyl-CoA carboxylase biotin carboxyl carrier protein subunit [Ignavibacteriales bacterium]|nr:MAG: acetyl-CoA carboxylase biotin carboxyl carrier protein subunit [Ignavibacteriales bacterium]